MKATLKDGSIVQVKSGLDWSLELGVTPLTFAGFYPWDILSVKLDSLMTSDRYLECVVKGSCRFSSKALSTLGDKIAELRGNKGFYVRDNQTGAIGFKPAHGTRNGKPPGDAFGNSFRFKFS